MNKKPPQRKGNGNGNNGDTDWGDEVAKAVGLIGKVFAKIFSYAINIILTIVLIGIITGTIVAGAFAIYVKNYIDPDLASFDLLATGQSETTKIYYMDYTDREHRIGTPIEIEDQRLYGAENRMWAPYSDMPSYLIEAFVSIEDHRFWDHHGVDWFRTIKAGLNFMTGGSRFGASTITQQLIKNVTGEDQVTIQRKVQEILRALEIEKVKDKSEIIELYLNTIFLSQRSYGVQAAAYTYFGKDVSQLTLIECAALASIPQYPTRYDPVQYPENNKERRNAVLDRMLELGKITQQEYNSAYNKDLILNLQYSTLTTATNSWYTDQVIRDTIQLLMKAKNVPYETASKMIYSSGLKIITVMDPEVQSTLEDVFEDDTNFPAVKSILQPECSMVIIDPVTGDVLGLVGGRGEKTDNRLFNYATQAKRPPGSSIKPVSVYGPAMENGIITYGSVIDDVPLNFGDEKNNGGTTSYSRPDGWPSNYPKGYRGLTTINDAIARSVNTVSVRVLQKLTLKTSFDFVKNKLHLSVIDYLELTGGKSITDMDYSPLGLGELSYGVSVEELTAAYCIFDNKGVYNEPRTVIKILDSKDNVIIENDSSGEVVISEQTASIMTKLLQNVVTRATGTAHRISLQYSVDVAGKTGTTNMDNDRWFVGYTPYYVGGVWFGYTMPKSLNGFSISPSTTIWDIVMTKLHEKFINSGEPVKKFELADGIVTKTYCRDSGKLITDACKADPRGSRAETGYFTQATAPTEACDVHIPVVYDKSTGGVADENCPVEKRITYGLLNVTSRRFPCQINVVDAQYVWRDLPKSIKPYVSLTDPFFLNAIPQGTYVGISAADSQFNHYCTEHYDPDKPKETTTLVPDTDYEDETTSSTVPNPETTTTVKPPITEPAEITSEPETVETTTETEYIPPTPPTDETDPIETEPETVGDTEQDLPPSIPRA